MTQRSQKNDAPKANKESKFDQKQPLRHPQAVVTIEGDRLQINKQVYQVLVNKEEALDLEALRQKYDPYLNQYDFIVGDISSTHLRLKGFYRDNVQTAIDRKKQTIADYIMEYCNPGSPYFVLELLSPVHHFRPGRRKKYGHNHCKRSTVAFKRYRVRQTHFKKHETVAEQKGTGNHHSFVIKKRKGTD